LAKTGLAIWQRGVLVATCTTPSNNDTHDSYREHCSTNGSHSALRTSFDKGARNPDAGTTDEFPPVAAGCYQEATRRAEWVRFDAARTRKRRVRRFIRILILVEV
jgi:hypothetical protein